MKITKTILSLVLVMGMTAMQACSDDEKEFRPDGPVTLTVTDSEGNAPEAIDFGYFGGHQVLTLKSNAPWSIVKADGADWLTVSNRDGDPTTDEEPRYIKLSAEPIGESPLRSCKVTFSALGVEKTITVTQRPAELVDPSGFETAFAANRNMGAGVNLWNTLDATGDWFDPDDIVACETCWGQPLAKQEWFDAVAASGFKAVRVPVTWKIHLDADDNVKEPWMARVEEVVNYGLNAGLYVILNVHHDTGDGGWVQADLANIEPICARFSKLWTQIANRFNKYGDKLLFEGYNEVLDGQNSWVEPVEGGYEAINILAQTFVTTVRATGGNNAHRNLIVNTYGGGGSATRLDNLRLPEDSAGLGHLLVEVHNYTPSNFSNLDGSLTDLPDEKMPLWTAEFEQILGKELDLLIKFSNERGVPVVIGECGAYDRILEEERAKYGKFISTYAKGRANISVFFWGQLIDRTTCEELYPLFIDGLLEGLN